jgi:hypothetical protein
MQLSFEFRNLHVGFYQQLCRLSTFCTPLILEFRDLSLPICIRRQCRAFEERDTFNLKGGLKQRDLVTQGSAG